MYSYINTWYSIVCTYNLGYHALKRATDAAIKTGLEQKIRRTKESIDHTTEKYDQTNGMCICMYVCI
jgi:hypothetical protein